MSCIYKFFFCREGTTPWAYVTQTLSGRLRAKRCRIRKSNGGSEEDMALHGEDWNSLVKEETDGEHKDKDSGVYMDGNEKGVDQKKERVYTQTKSEGELSRKLTDSHYEICRKDCITELQKPKPRRSQIKLILKETYYRRRAEIEKYEEEKKPMIKTIIEQWPCFESGVYVSFSKMN